MLKSRKFSSMQTFPCNLRSFKLGKCSKKFFGKNCILLFSSQSLSIISLFWKKFSGISWKSLSENWNSSSSGFSMSRFSSKVFRGFLLSTSSFNIILLTKAFGSTVDIWFCANQKIGRASCREIV